MTTGSENLSPPEKPTPTCNFCSERQTPNVRMIKGPGVFICEECINVCRDLLDSRSPLPPKAAAETNQTDTGTKDSQPVKDPYTDIPGYVRNTKGVYIPAGFWYRLGAFLIDAVILFIAHSIAIKIIGVTGPDEQAALVLLNRVFEEALSGGTFSSATLSQMLEMQRPLLFMGWLNVFICLAYYTVFHGMLGATLGKLCLGLTVLKRDGSPLGYGWAFARYLGYFILARLAYTAWLIPFNAERRTLYDMVLGTNVFRTAHRFAASDTGAPAADAGEAAAPGAVASAADRQPALASRLSCQVAELIYYVSDVEQAIAFYHKTLGWPMEWRSGDRMVIFDVMASYQLVCVAAQLREDWEPEQPVPPPRLSFMCRDIRADIEKLKEWGCHVAELSGDEQSMLSTLLRDPFGAELFLWQDNVHHTAADSAARYRERREVQRTGPYNFAECLMFVADLDGAVEFYTKHLGFAIKEKHGTAYVALAIDDGPVLGLYRWSDWWDKPDAGTPPAPCRLCIEPNDLKTEYDLLKAAGVEVGELKGDIKGLAWFSLADPDGTPVTMWNYKG
ncbi:RDD family protein [bacterium]|nr:RDD family protein [bacterium]